MTETAAAERAELERLEREMPQAATSLNLPAVRKEQAPRKPRSTAPKQFSSSVIRAVIAVTKELGVIQKAGYNDFQKYKYTRWEDINEKLSPLLVEHGLLILAGELNRSLIEENDKGSTLAVTYEFQIVNEDGGSLPPCEGTGYARLRDQKGVTDDKAGLKAATQAYKKFCVNQFSIRSTDDDLVDDERRPMRVEDMRPLYQKFLNEITPIASLVELDQWKKDNLERVRASLHDKWLGVFNSAFTEKRKDLEDRAREYDEYTETHDPQTGEIAAVQAAPATPSPQPPAGAAKAPARK